MAKAMGHALHGGPRRDSLLGGESWPNLPQSVSGSQAPQVLQLSRCDWLASQGGIEHGFLKHTRHMHGIPRTPVNLKSCVAGNVT